MIVLGLSGGLRLGYQDASACLLRDGEVVAAVEEERLNRIKHAPGQLPELAIDWLLKSQGLEIFDIDAIAFHGSTWGREFEERLSAFFTHRYGHCPRIHRVHHHLAHAASAYYASGWESAMILTVDGSGDGMSTGLFHGHAGQIEMLKGFERPQSLGIFFSAITQFCGFRRDSDEYKVMGLASYGNPGAFDLSDFLRITNDGYELNSDYLAPIAPGAPQPTRQEPMFSSRLTRLLGEPRRPNEPITQRHKDIAAAAQTQLTLALRTLVKNLHERTGLRNLCLAGGVALNCRANQDLLDLDFVDDLYICPAPGDNGLALGAAYVVAKEFGDSPKPLKHNYLGPSYTDTEIEKILRLCGAKYTQVNDPALAAAELVLKGKIVGWFQGALEFGPRALGARSILANPCLKDVKDVLNSKIKFRESFRPFCPSVRIEDTQSLFRLKAATKAAAYMTVTADAKDAARELYPAIVHVDGTTRIQTVGDQFPVYRTYLDQIAKHLRHGITVNTSLNLNNQPIACSPRDALAAFYSSGMDALVMGSFVLKKLEND